MFDTSHPVFRDLGEFMGIHDVAVRSRRAAGVSAAVLAAVLLTGCTGGGNVPEETATASSNSSSSSRASASAESTANTGAGDTSTTTPAPSGSESPLPDDWRPQEPTVLATGQKIPGDYEPATLAHPARNVPKPVMPEEAKQETEAGAQAFLNYRADAQWYSIQTGDTSLIRQVTSTDCANCVEQYDSFDRAYSDGNWSGGGLEIQKIIPDSFIKRADGGYNLPVETVNYGLVTFRGGKVIERQIPFDLKDRFDVYILYKEGSWLYVTASPRGSM
ncbi:DUF6318 family protein [Kocuria salsicia]|uniref:DUF6318 family protein n=1 Tax=Kocuria salsicia TaxID=664639 RepID=A0ABV3K8H7_9MICC